MRSLAQSTRPLNVRDAREGRAATYLSYATQSRNRVLLSCWTELAAPHGLQVAPSHIQRSVQHQRYLINDDAV
jgi:hypothetical protein